MHSIIMNSNEKHTRLTKRTDRKLNDETQTPKTGTGEDRTHADP